MSENLVNTAVQVKLDGQDFILRYRALAFIRYAEECKGDLLHDTRKMGEALQEYSKLVAGGDFQALAPILITLRDILWAGLVDAQPMIGRTEVASMFGLNDFPVLMPLITDAMMRGLPSVATTNRPTKPAPAPRRNSRLSNGAGSGLNAGTQAEFPSPSSAG